MPAKKKAKKKTEAEELGISQAALDRKKRFLAEKEKAGSFKDLQEKQKVKDWTVYFNDFGDIVCLTQNDVDVKDNWKTYDFSQEQLKILVDNKDDLAKYCINIDPSVDNLYSIQLKEITSIYTESEKEFLNEIEYGRSTSFDIKVAVNSADLVVTMSNKTKEPYKDVYPISATIQGQRLLKFFLTAEHDPHVMFHYEIISLAELITEKKVVREMPADLRRCSVYTVKLFDKYQRT
jgi:hypothetical protein|tara:strand:+ start:1016 stop:1720 length:705 start_codon:yes stop_codon:yes gene_type:complete